MHIAGAQPVLRLGVLSAPTPAAWYRICRHAKHILLQKLSRTAGALGLLRSSNVSNTGCEIVADTSSQTGSGIYCAPALFMAILLSFPSEKAAIFLSPA